jgi:16S rRNA (guanine527-N7)-methyltransferase
VKRLAELAVEWGLPRDAPAQLATILSLVRNESASITTVRDPQAGVERHIADSLSGLIVPELRAATRIADLGTGGGFPGLVLAAALPSSSIRLVESVARKCAFLRRAAAAAGLTNVEVVSSRAEDWHAGAGSNEVVTARAVAALPVLVEYAAPLLAEGGVLVAWKGRPEAAEVAQAARAAAAIGLAVMPTVQVAGQAGAEHRTLYLYRKVAPTPPQ